MQCSEFDWLLTCPRRARPRRNLDWRMLPDGWIEGQQATLHQMPKPMFR